MATHTISNNDGSVTFNINEAANWDVESIDIVTGSQTLTVELLNNDGTVKQSYTLPPGTVRSQSIPNNRRVQATLESITRPDQPDKIRMVIPHNIRWG